MIATAIAALALAQQHPAMTTPIDFDDPRVAEYDAALDAAADAFEQHPDFESFWRPALTCGLTFAYLASDTVNYSDGFIGAMARQTMSDAVGADSDLLADDIVGTRPLVDAFVFVNRHYHLEADRDECAAFFAETEERIQSGDFSEFEPEPRGRDLPENIETFSFQRAEIARWLLSHPSSAPTFSNWQGEVLACRAMHPEMMAESDHAAIDNARAAFVDGVSAALESEFPGVYPEGGEAREQVVAMMDAFYIDLYARALRLGILDPARFDCERFAHGGPSGIRSSPTPAAVNAVRRR